MYGRFMAGEIERCRETMPLPNDGFLHMLNLVYFILRINCLARLPTTEPDNLLDPAIKIAEHLASKPVTVTPINHHAVVVAAATLVELLKYDETKDDAERGLSLLLDRRDNVTAWDGAVHEMVARKQRENATATAGENATGTQSDVAARNLQELANLATATNDDPVASGTNDLLKVKEPPILPFPALADLFQNGYLTSLSG